jgi:hypothetical protein
MWDGFVVRRATLASTSLPGASIGGLMLDFALSGAPAFGMPMGGIFASDGESDTRGADSRGAFSRCILAVRILAVRILAMCILAVRILAVRTTQ